MSQRPPSPPQPESSDADWHDLPTRPPRSQPTATDDESTLTDKAGSNSAAPQDDADDPSKSIPPGSTKNLAATNRLPTESLTAFENAGMIYGQATDVGMQRDQNEDSVLAFSCNVRSRDDLPDFGLFVVADGMGGHVDGDKASALAVRLIANQLMRTIYLSLLRGVPMSDLPPVSELLLEAVTNANGEIRRQTKDGGTTCTAALVIGRRVFLAHTGDSRAYLITRESIEQVTRDHSLARRLEETGVMTREEADNHPQGNQLYSALGMSDETRIDSWTRNLTPGTRMLLCSDGLWNMVPDEEIHRLTLANALPHEACARMVSAANEAGGQDNISVILLQIT